MSAANLIKTGLLIVLALLISGSSAQAQPDSHTQPAKFKKGELPKDKRYWDYQKWYLKHSVVDVIVSGQDESHLLSVLQQIKTLKEQKVLLRRIIVVGGYNFAQLDSKMRETKQDKSMLEKVKSELEDASRPISAKNLRNLQEIISHSSSLAAAAESAGIGMGTPVGDIDQLLSLLKVEASPTWIVTYHGKNYIYEGFSAINGLFSKTGEFIDGGE